MRRMVSLFLLLGGLISAQVNPAPQGSVYKIGGGVSQPRLVSKVEPEYSEEARRLGVNSTVVLSVVVSADGSPRNMTVARRSGFGLDEKAMEAVAQWRFNPGMKEEKPVNVYATIEVNFRLLDRADLIGGTVQEAGLPSAVRIAFLPADSTSPVAISGRLPKYQPPSRVTFHLTFDVNQKGDVENLLCAEAAPDSILESIRKIRFQPATLAGQPIRSTAKLELSY